MHNIKYIAPYQNELALPYNVKYKIGEVVVVIVVVVVVLVMVAVVVVIVVVGSK